MLNQNVCFRYCKKDPHGSFFTVSPVGATPIENIHIIFNKRSPHGTTFPRATRDYYLWMFSIIALR